MRKMTIFHVLMGESTVLFILVYEDQERTRPWACVFICASQSFICILEHYQQKTPAPVNMAIIN